MAETMTRHLRFPASFLLCLLLFGAPGRADEREIRECERETAAAYRDCLQKWVVRFPAVRIDDAFPRSREEWLAHAQRLRAALPEVFCLPKERCPLNPRIVAEKDYGDFSVQALVYDSEPGSSVTANLYLPHPPIRRAPALLFANGHGGWKGAWFNRYAGRLYARAGCVCLTMDTIGEGERCHGGGHDIYVDAAREAGKSIIGKCAWDLIRAVDYLASREDVDKARIGLAGHSMGGTLTMYVAALDERIALAMPCVGMSNFHQMLNTPSYCWRPRGLLAHADQPELAALCAPRCAYLILHGTRDTICGPIEGLQETYARARRVFDLFGRGDDIALQLIEGGHKPFFLSKAAYCWVARKLGLHRVSAAEAERVAEVERTFGERERMIVADPGVCLTPELMCLSPSERTEARYSMAGWIAGATAGTPPPFQPPKDAGQWQGRRAGILAVLQRLLRLPDTEPARPEVLQIIEGTDHQIEELTVGRMGLRSFLAVPKDRQGKRPAVIYLHGSGTRVAALDDPKMQQWIGEGRIVLAMDTVKSYVPRVFGGDDTDLLMGFSTVAANVGHMRDAVDYLCSRPDVDPARIACLDEVGDSAFYAAALDERIGEVTITSRGGAQFLDYRREGVVPDLPKIAGRAEILATIAPRKLSLLWDERNCPLRQPPLQYNREMDECETGIAAVYRLLGAEAQFRAQIRRAPRNVALGAKATASSSADFHPAQDATDGVLRSDWWSENGLPQWIAVDLGRSCRVGRARILFYYADGRYYQYRLLGSADGENWVELADASRNTVRCPTDGVCHSFRPREMRYLKVVVLYNSHVPAAHIYEIEAFQADGAEGTK